MENIVTARTISVPEAGRILGIGRDAAYSAARAGQLPVIRIGRLLRVSTTALDELLADPSGRQRGGVAGDA